MEWKIVWAGVLGLLGIWSLIAEPAHVNAVESVMKEPQVKKSEKEWRESLTKEQYHVLREKGTEAPFSGKYWNTTDEGSYACAGCGAVLFDSNDKYDSGCGWPSFFDAVDPDKLIFKEDLSFGISRTEVLCARCGGHLGHIFDDGPKPTGQRYCINSASLEFSKSQEKLSQGGEDSGKS